LKVTSIIRCRNEEAWIGHAIQSFIEHFPEGEILIIDNNSTDRSIEIVKLFDRYDIKIINIDNYTPGKALNLGVKIAKYDTILIQSAHTVLKKIDKIQLREDLSKNVAVFGNQIPVYRGKKITKRYVWSHFKKNKIIQNMFSEIENRQFLHNAFCFYRKRILEKHQFDEKLIGKEDRYWADKIVKEGFKYLYNSVSLVSEHYYTDNGATWKGLG